MARSGGTRGPRPRAIPWAWVLEELRRLYDPEGEWRVPYLRDHAETPFQVLIGTILSQRTRDEATDVASAELFRAFPTVDALAEADPKEVERRIRPVGFYRTKARGVIACARALRDRFGGKVPEGMEELLTLPMVGRKTANCTLVFGFGVPAVPVDTHVHRIANRLGAVRTRTPEETEMELRRRVPQELWAPINPLLVQHGQNLCRPLRPRCDHCPLRSVCATGTPGRRPRPGTDRPGPRPR